MLRAAQRSAARVDDGRGDVRAASSKRGAGRRRASQFAELLLERDAPVLKALAQYIAYEVAIGLNGRVWCRAATLGDAIVVANALENAAFLEDTAVAPMVGQVINAMRAKTASQGLSRLRCDARGTRPNNPRWFFTCHRRAFRTAARRTPSPFQRLHDDVPVQPWNRRWAKARSRAVELRPCADLEHGQLSTASASIPGQPCT